MKPIHYISILLNILLFSIYFKYFSFRKDFDAFGEVGQSISVVAEHLKNDNLTSIANGTELIERKQETRDLFYDLFAEIGEAVDGFSIAKQKTSSDKQASDLLLRYMNSVDTLRRAYIDFINRREIQHSGKLAKKEVTERINSFNASCTAKINVSESEISRLKAKEKALLLNVLELDLRKLQNTVIYKTLMLIPSPCWGFTKYFPIMFTNSNTIKLGQKFVAESYIGNYGMKSWAYEYSILWDGKEIDTKDFGKIELQEKAKATGFQKHQAILNWKLYDNDKIHNDTTIFEFLIN